MDISNFYYHIRKLLRRFFEVISYKLHLEKYPNWCQLDTESRRMASALLVDNATFVFCIVWTTVFRSSFYLHGPTKKIQGWSLDLLDILGQVEVTRGDLPFIWNDGVKQYFSCFENGMKMVSLINIVPTMPPRKRRV